MVESAPRRGSGGRSGSVSQLRLEPSAGFPAGNGAVCRQHDTRGSQRRGSLERRLYVCQRTAGAALRHSAGLRQPLPSSDAPEPRSARRAARTGSAAGDDVLPRSHVSRVARQMAAEQYFRFACSAASSGRGHQPRGEQARRDPDVDTRAAGATPAESLLQQLSFDHRSARVRAGEFRRHRRMADR